jgi:deazaflavin-dependent oxidoreductase (nitroreductase family)
MIAEQEKLITEKLPYPSGSVMKYVYKTPILLYRLGLGAYVGRLFMIMTTTGRKSGLPRRTAIEFHERAGRKYVMVGWTQSDWYQNLLANPVMTIQTASGVERVRARRLETDEEYREAWDVAAESRSIKAIMDMSGIHMTRESFVAQKHRFVLLTFDPTDESAPEPLEADLKWVVPLVLNIVGTLILQRAVRRWIKSRRARPQAK